MLERVWRKGNLPTLLVECKFVQPLWRSVWKFLRKLKIELPYDPGIPLLGTYLDKTLIWKATCTPMFIAALFTIAKPWNKPKCPSTGEWIKMWYIYMLSFFFTFFFFLFCLLWLDGFLLYYAWVPFSLYIYMCVYIYIYIYIYIYENINL